MTVTVSVSVSSVAPTAAGTRPGQETREERMELGHPVFRDVNRDLR
jgi:hypothetical protein